MSGQPERYRDRSRILRDTKISHAAVRLYLLLDDEARGEMRLSKTQHQMAKIIGVGARQIRRVIQELESQRYLSKDHRISGNVYEFIRTKMPASEIMDRSEMSARVGQKCPLPLITQETHESPLTPASGGIEILSLEGSYPGCEICPSCEGCGNVGRSEKRSKVCGWCSGRGFMWPRREQSA